MPMITRPEVASRITHAVDAMDETIKDIRATIFELQSRDDGAAGPDLRADIFALVEEMTGMLGFAPSLRLGTGLGAGVSPEVAEQVLAALREALSNVARHAQASQVDVTVDTDPAGMLTVQVTDDGIGIPAGGRRSGLRNLASRADKLGGELRLEPANLDGDRPGTRLEWRVPQGALQGLDRGEPGGGPVLAVGVQVPAVQQLRGDADEVLARPGRPRDQAEVPQPGHLARIGHLARLADGGDAPAGPVAGIQAVHLERDHGAAGGGGELAAAVGAQHDIAVIDGEVDQFHGGQRAPGIDNPAYGFGGHQREALIAGQLPQGRAVGIHDPQDAVAAAGARREEGP